MRERGEAVAIRVGENKRGVVYGQVSISSIAMRLPCVCVAETDTGHRYAPGEAVALLWENNSPLRLVSPVTCHARAVHILHFRIFADHR